MRKFKYLGTVSDDAVVFIGFKVLYVQLLLQSKQF